MARPTDGKPRARRGPHAVRAPVLNVSVMPYKDKDGPVWIEVTVVEGSTNGYPMMIPVPRTDALRLIAEIASELKEKLEADQH